jgi:hypothetical protein
MVEQVYRPRRPKESALWQCLCAHFYDFIQAYPEKYEKKYVFSLPIMLRSMFQVAAYPVQWNRSRAPRIPASN